MSDEKGVLEILDGIIKGIEARIGNDYSEGTLKHYKTTKARLIEFLKKRFGRNDIGLSSADYSFLNSFDIYLKTEYHLKPNTAVKPSKQGPGPPLSLIAFKISRKNIFYKPLHPIMISQASLLISVK
ncbi:MAG: phage integrase SAM-like domain-containing protein [Mangrovibacterium sp.]|nr:phage integrase SAM-like domain-containing protein [Mangrovibacterium sp.]